MKPITKAAGNTCLIAGLALTILPFMASPVGAQSPTLGITNDPVSGVSVFWPVADAAYSLQWTPDLEPPIVWQPFPFSPALSADANNLVVNLASLQATNPQAFFQLVSNPVVVPAAPSVVTGGVYPLNTFYFLEGSVQPNALDTTYWFQWGQTTTPYPEITSSGVVGGSNTAPVGVEIEIDGLAAGTLYHYQIYGSNSDGISSGGDLTFTTPASLPDAIVQTFAASNVTTNSAQLLGSVNPNGSSWVGWFEWGTNSSYGNQTLDFPGGPPNFQAVDESDVISNLLPNTTYDYRIVAYNGGPDEAVGSNVEFTTSAPFQQPPPAVITGAASSVSSTSENINGSVNPEGAATSYIFLIGTTSPPGGTVGSPLSAGSGSSYQSVPTVTLTGLSASTTYYYAIVANNYGGSTEGAVSNFTTLAGPQAPPAVTIVAPPTSESPTSETLHGTVNPEGATTTYAFAYSTSPTGITSSPGTFSAGNNYSFNSVSNTVYNLAPSTTYYYTIMATNSGGSTTSPPAVFTTAGEQLPPSATTYGASLITSNYAELNGIANPNGADTHTFFEWGTNTSYGQVVGGADIGGGETTLGQVYGLGGLTPNTTYHYQIFASNYLGMVTYGGDTNFTTALAGPPAGMVLIPGGSFVMGDTLDGESDASPTNVNVSAFYMDTNLVSLSQWQTVYNWAVLQGYIFGTGIGATAANNPVQTISWGDAVQWCNARSQQSGLTPVYYTDQAFTEVLGANGNYGDTVYANWAANGYRLPTEAEWERAARGGTNGLRFPWGDYIIDAAPPSGLANYYSNGDSVPSGGYDYGSVAYPPSFAGPNPAAYYIGEPLPWTTAVGLFAPNAYGLCDMAGNLQEWCWDWYAGPPYPTGSPYLGGTDPRGPASSTGYHVTRGGSWGDPAYNLRCANRIFYMTATGDLYIGFRCVKGP